MADRQSRAVRARQYFQVEGTNSPDTFTNTVSLTPGTTSLDSGALNLTISIVPSGSNERLVFSYSTASGGPLSQPSQDWEILQVGLNAAVPVNFTAAFDEFLNSAGTAITPTSSVFPGNTVMSNPVPGGAGSESGIAASPISFRQDRCRRLGRSSTHLIYSTALEFLPPMSAASIRPWSSRRRPYQLP